MLVKMSVDLQGFTVRSDGSTFEYPRRGQTVDLPRADAIELISQGYAIPVPTQGAVETTRQPADDAEYRMVSAAQVIARPEHQEPVAIPSKPVEPAVEPTSPVRATESVAPAPPAPPAVEPEARRGPGRPRKYPRPGEVAR
jgi:hypothetical protein